MVPLNFLLFFFGVMVYDGINPKKEDEEDNDDKDTLLKERMDRVKAFRVSLSDIDQE